MEVQDAGTASSAREALDRLSFETLISDTSATLMAAAGDRIDRAIEDALDRVRTFFGADRCGLMPVTGGGHVVRVSHASYSDGAGRVSGDIDLGALFPWSRRRLVDERLPVVMSRTVDLPREADQDRASWEAQGTRSNLAVPIVTGDAVTHIIVIHTLLVECEWPLAYIPRLRLLGELMASALERREAFEALQTSEARLERAAAAARCGLWEVDVPSGRMWVTAETRRLYSLSPDEVVDYGRFIGLVHPDDREGVTRGVSDAMATGQSIELIYRIRRDDGRERWMQANAQRCGPGRLMGASVDVTARRNAEARAREEAARVAAAIDAAQLGFSEWRVSDDAPYVDTRVRELFGLADIGRREFFDQWFARVHPDDRPRLSAHREQLLTGEVDHATIHYRYEHPTRGTISIHQTVRRLIERESEGEQVTLVTAVQDVTDTKKREDDLREALEELGRLRERLEQENIYLRRDAQREAGPDLVAGESAAIRRVLRLADQVAPTPSTVLLIGETGTGKERFASYIHEASARSSNPMVRVNCSAIPAALIESELFGREKGAYTGAYSKQIGRFELAHRSTIFLDEIGELPPEVQVKLLRVLQERAIERLGNPRPIEVDVRIIAATNRDLEAAVGAGTFRADLYYRLNVFPILIPPLRERRDDLPQLVETLVGELMAKTGKRFESVAKSSMEALLRYDWPGNVRELRNVLERAIIVSPGPVLTVPLPTGARAAPITTSAGPETRNLRQLERAHILGVLHDTHWRIRGRQGAAELLGLKPTTLEAMMARLGITRPG